MFGFSAFSADLPAVIEAESGIVGSDFTTAKDVDVNYVTIKSTVPGENPSIATRVITYTVTFPDSGSYDLYMRYYVGAGGADDDSYFYGNGFGEKDPTNNNDWIRINNLSGKGYNAERLAVGGGGNSSNRVWVWLNLSKYGGDEPPITFRVEKDNLTQTFQMAGREDGLWVDKFVFGRSGMYFTVKNLNNGEEGSVTDPGEEPKQDPIAKGNDKFLGCSYSSNSKYNFESYWNQVTPENAGKWQEVENTRDMMVWRGLDEAYHFARANNFPFKLHTLVWGSQQPSWVAAVTDSAEMRAEIEEWFAAIAERYDTLEYIDVVNEPLHVTPTYINALGGTGTTGWDWVINSFKLARQYFPKSKLLINEYSITNNDADAKRYIQIINLLKKDSLIDGIGVQAHYFSLNNSSEQTKRNLDSIAATGLPVYPSELDIDGLTDAVHVREYMRVFPIFWEHPSVPGMTLWGYRPGMWRTDQMAYLINEDRQPRPAMLWLRAYVNGTFVANESIEVTSVNGSTNIDSKSGQLELTAAIAPENSTLKNIIWSVSNKSIATVNDTGLVTAIKDGTVTVTASSIEYGSKVKGTISITISNQVSIKSTAIADFSISPNPVSNELRLSNSELIEKVEISNLMGQKIKTVQKTQTTIDVSELQQGIYFLSIFDKTGKSSSHKFIKK